MCQPCLGGELPPMPEQANGERRPGQVKGDRGFLRLWSGYRRFGGSARKESPLEELGNGTPNNTHHHHHHHESGGRTRWYGSQQDRLSSMIEGTTSRTPIPLFFHRGARGGGFVRYYRPPRDAEDYAAGTQKVPSPAKSDQRPWP